MTSGKLNGSVVGHAALSSANEIGHQRKEQIRNIGYFAEVLALITGTTGTGSVGLSRDARAFVMEFDSWLDERAFAGVLL